MGREWAAVELLECIGDELSPDRHVERASWTKLAAIRVLPAPVAGDLFVTNAARGDIGVILFYLEEGEEKLGNFERQLVDRPIQWEGGGRMEGRAYGAPLLSQVLRRQHDRTKRKRQVSALEKRAVFLERKILLRSLVRR